jgi:outer membrane receptor protein involved in Fe transport
MDIGDEILITAKKIDILRQDIPHVKSIIKVEEIQRYGSSEISDILKPLPAIRIEGNDLDGRNIQIRGSNSDEVNVYLDGILINAISFDNVADLSIIPVENIERLEVVKGGNLAFLGNGAFGGILNITTQQKPKKSFSVKGKVGSFETQHLMGSFNIPLTKYLLINYFGQLSRFSPEIEYFPSERYSTKSKNDQILTSKQNHHMSLNYFIKNGRFNGRFIGYFFDYNKPNWESSYNNYLFAVTYSGDILSLKNFELQVNHLYSNDVVKRKPSGNAQYTSSYNSNRLNLKIFKKFPIKKGEMKILTEYFHNDLKSDTKVKDINWKNNLYHAFIYDNRLAIAGIFSFKDCLEDLPILSWETFIGLRSDFLASGDNDLTNMIGAQLNYTMDRCHLSPYVNYGKNIKYLTLLEQTYTRDLFDVEQRDTTNARLEPEYSSLIEGGLTIKYFPVNRLYNNLEFSWGLFSRTVYNSLIKRPFDDLIAKVQQGRNKTFGVETSIKLNDLFRYFKLSAAFIYLDIENQLLYAYKPDKNASIKLGYISHFGLYFSTTYFYEGQSLAWYYDFDNEVQTETIEPYEDMDVSIGFRRRFFNTLEFDFQVSGYNIFDNSGFKYYYLKKRCLQASLAIKY